MTVKMEKLERVASCSRSSAIYASVTPSSDVNSCFLHDTTSTYACILKSLPPTMRVRPRSVGNAHPSFTCRDANGAPRALPSVLPEFCHRSQTFRMTCRCNFSNSSGICGGA